MSHIADMSYRTYGTYSPIAAANLQLLVEGVTSGAKNISDLLADQFFHQGPGGSKVLAGIEFLRVLTESPADAGGHGEAQVGIDIDFSTASPSSHFDVSFRNTRSINSHFTAVLVNLLDEI